MSKGDDMSSPLIILIHCFRRQFVRIFWGHFSNKFHKKALVSA